MSTKNRRKRGILLCYKIIRRRGYRLGDVALQKAQPMVCSPDGGMPVHDRPERP